MKAASYGGQGRAAPMPIEIVAVGASLGGLHAIEVILRDLPVPFSPAVVLVQHRRPDAESHLCAILQRHTSMPVCEPNDKQPIRPSTVYLAPANYHLMVEAGSFALSVDPPVWFARPSIDVFFESVANAYGRRALGMVLTGASEDGALGALAIKSRGGRVLVQDPETAESPAAPKAALARGAAHEVVPLRKLAARVAAHCATVQHDREGAVCDVRDD